MTLGLACAGVGLWTGRPVTALVVILVAAMSIAVGLFRRAPAIALLLVWLAAATEALSGTLLIGVQFGVVVVVGYGVARHGRVPTVWLGGISVPVGTALTEYYLLGHSGALPSAVYLATPLVHRTGVSVVTAYVLGLAVVGTPWTVGLLVRLNARYHRSTAERERARSAAAAAQEAATLRTRQTQLARDVHDLVGHSLAVIIAQADAARITATTVGAADSGRAVGEALGNIAAVARRSLGEVREVLMQTRDTGPAAPTGSDLSELVDRVRASGTDVRATVHGEPTDVGPQVQTTLYRVLQEMLTNAIKHGQPGGRIAVEQTWEPTGVRVCVSNGGATTPPPPPSSGVGYTDHPGPDDGVGLGVPGMRLRLDEVGGTLDLSRTTGDPPTYTATARVPLGPARVS